MDTTLFAFVEDFIDEGDLAFSRISDLGVHAVAPAFVYHSARDVLPHAGARRVRFMESGSTRFTPDLSLYESCAGLPFEATVHGKKDPLDHIRDRLGDVGIRMDAWVVFGHSSCVGTRRPDLTIETAHGDRLLTSLCPTNPLAVEYFCAITSDLGRRGITTIHCEALDFPPIEHGYHHERWPVPLSETSRFLMGLCFCTDCMQQSENLDVDAATARNQVTSFLDRAISDTDPLMGRALSRVDIAEAGGPEALDYVMRRGDRLTKTVELLTSAGAAAGVELSYVDLTGSRSAGDFVDHQSERIADRVWRYGIDVSKLSAHIHRYSMLGYGINSAARLSDDLAAYTDALNDDCELGCILRPQPSAVGSKASPLGPLIDAARDGGCPHLGIYAYGFMRLRDLDLIGRDLRSRNFPDDVQPQ